MFVPRFLFLSFENARSMLKSYVKLSNDLAQEVMVGAEAVITNVLLFYNLQSRN